MTESPKTKKFKLRLKRSETEKFPEEVAVFVSDSKRTIFNIVLILSLCILLAALYFFLKSMISPKPKVFLKIFDITKNEYRHTSLKEINQTIDEKKSVLIQVKVIAKPDPYTNVYGERAIRDYAAVSLQNSMNQELGLVFIKLTPTEKGYLEGIGKFRLNKKVDRDNHLIQEVRVVLTNKNRTADKLPVRVKISD